MSDKLHLSPDDDFPEDLSVVPDQTLQILDSQDGDGLSVSGAGGVTAR